MQEDLDRSLADRAYGQLRDRIVSSALPPGTQLSVPALARTMNISRSPVREAVQRLIHEGLATHVLNRGAEVARLDIAELMEIYDVKEPLGGLASRLAATRLTEDGAAALRAMVADQERALARSRPASELMALDVEFHRFITTAAGNATLAATIEQFTSKTNLAFPTAWTSPEYARYSIDEHQAIADALCRGDAEQAERASLVHARNVRARLARWHSAIADGTVATSGTLVG